MPCPYSVHHRAAVESQLNPAQGGHMKVGIIGAGGVGSATLLSLVMRGVACQVVVLDKNQERAKGVVADLQYGATLSPAVELLAGNYSDLADAVLVIVTAGINEKAGGATDRSDPAGESVAPYCR